ncbi:MAG TPA: SDR family NAD(P)-dependent oxidoreductase, partial [Burkholderiales bacterium]|nr:SDR family NAD(P)-dependent oxidoreductase [Burkholderiales bacterium]
MKRYRALLTGASGGIGRAIAAALGPHCDELVLVGRDAARLAQSAAAAGPTARTVVADLARAEDRDAISLPGINLLINNAGAGDFGWLEGQSDATLARIVETNLLAPMQLVRRLLPELARQPAAWIVNVGSIMGYLGYPGHAAYC